MKLGELLTQRDLISEVELDQALNSQLIHGGHLGTCLIEHGHITEDDLGQVLADSFNIGCASKSAFENIPRFVIDLFSAEIVERLQAVPFRLENDCLDVAMIDPTDLRAIDEMARMTGRNIRAWIAPEIRIVQAMDHYYYIPRRMRYITLSRQLDDSAPESFGDETCDGWEPSGVDEPNLQKVSDAEKVAINQLMESIDLGESPDNEPEAIANLAPAIESDAEESEKAFDTLSGLFVRVASRKKLGQLAIEFASRTLPRTLLFEIRGGSAYPWNAYGFELAEDADTTLGFELTSEPLFGLLRGERHYRGPVPSDGSCDPFFDTLLSEPPSEMLLMPTYVDDQLVALLYADDGGVRRIPSDVVPYRRLATKIGQALQLIRIKRKIRSG